MRRLFEAPEAAAVPLASRLERRGDGVAPVVIGALSLVARPAFAAPRVEVPAPSPAEAPPATPTVDVDAVRKEAEAAGIKAAQAKVEAIVHRYLDGVEALAEARGVGRRLEAEEIVELALTVAGALVGAAAATDGAALVDLLDRELATFDVSAPVRLRLAPVDIAFIEAQRPELLARAELVSDDALSVGGFVIEHGDRIVDASVDARLAGLRDGLVELLRGAAAEERSC